jgi:hypothetical protein
VEYKPLLPPGQHPPADLNLAIMQKYRSQMEPHYLREQPAFVV